MIYNPIFEEEEERSQQVKDLRDAIKYRATRDQFLDVFRKLVDFSRVHPLATLTAVAGLVGFSIGGKR